MDNRDLFRFPFVNRITEKKIISDFLSLNPPEAVLWLSGRSGSGKSRLLNHSLSSHEASIVINREENESSEEFIIKAIKLLQQYAKLNFIDFLRDNYSEIIDISKNITKSLLNVFSGSTAEPIYGIAGVFFDTGKLLITKQQKKESISASLSRYVKAISESNKALNIVFDNFSRCSEKEVHLLNSIMAQHYSNIHFIIVTTDEDIEFHPYVNQICEKLPLRRVQVSFFENSVYFFEIIETLFEYDSIGDGTSEALFNYCQGSPQNLVSAIRNFYLNHYITFLPEKERAILDSFHARTLLLSGNGSFRLKNYTFRDQLVLIVIQQIGTPIDKVIAKGLISYTASNQLKLLYSPFSEKDINDAILNYIDTSILTIDINGIIQFAHDSLLIQIQHDIECEMNIKNMMPLLSGDIVSFFEEYGLCECYSRAMAFHSYQANTFEWQQKVSNYIEQNIENGYLSDAVYMANKIDRMSELDIKCRYAISKCFYDNGQYKKSEECLNDGFPLPESLENVKKYEILLLAAQTQNMLQKKEMAFSHALQAIESAKPNEEKLITASALLYCILLEMGSDERAQQARELFYSIECRYSASPYELMPRALGKLYRLSCDQYKNKNAIQLLMLARQVAQSYSDSIEYAYASGNLGFAYYREGDLKKAETYLNEAIGSLTDIQDHETAYAMNNLAVIAMRRGELDESIEILKQANYICRSPYAMLAILVNLLIAFVATRQSENAERIFNKLCTEQNFLNATCRVIIRKVNNALAYAALYFNFVHVTEIEKFTKSALQAGRRTNSEQITKQIIHIAENNNNEVNDYQQPISGDYWLLTYSH